MAPVSKCHGFKVGQLVRVLGVPRALGLVLKIEAEYYSMSEYYICWLKVLWSDLGPPANWERSELNRPHSEDDLY